MPIVVCGINHKTAPVGLREKIVFPADKLALYLHDLSANENLHEAVLLSTCNRSELYCDTDDIEKVITWFCQQQQVSSGELRSALYLYQDTQAIEHIMRVACGLDSMVLGEPQILGQMKDAFSESCAAGTVGTLFNRLFQHVFAVAKEVRTSTAIGACPVSVSSTTVSFVQQSYPGKIADANVLLIGAGITIDLALRYLKSHTPKQILIANRNKENALLLAGKHECDVVPFEQLNAALTDADIIISATGSALPVVTSHMVGAREKLVFIMDIAVPRDVEAAVADLPNVQLYSIDDLRVMIQQNLRGREHAAEKAEEVIRQRSKDFITWLNSFDVVATTIRAYRNQVEALCEAELVKFTRLLQRGENPELVLASFANALTKKLLHTPSVQLRQAGFEGRLDVLQLAQQLFAIPESEVLI